MNIEKRIDGNTVTFILEGWMDTQTTPDFEKAMDELEPDTKALVLDLGELEYTSSAGVRQLVAAYKKMNGALTLKNVSPGVYDVLRMTGLDKRIRII